MGKIRIEICVISARGLPRSSSLWKLQWFAVGWINPADKYCSKIDSSGGSTPTWRTKFSVAADEEKVDYLRSLVLNVEVRCREAIFLREKLHGVVSIPLREFVERFNWEGRRSSGVEEVGSFQLRGRRSGEPRGFVDVSIRIWEEQAANDASPLNGDHPNSSSLPYSGRSEASLSMEDGTTITYTDASRQRQHEEKPQTQPPQQPFIRRRERTSTSMAGNSRPHVDAPTHPTTPYPYVQSHLGEHENGYIRRSTPPPPPPPSNTGFLPSFFPSTYAGAPPDLGGFGTGVGAGALAAGAVLFGDDFMSASGFPNSGGLGHV